MIFLNAARRAEAEMRLHGRRALKETLGEVTIQAELWRDAMRRLKAGLHLDPTRLPK